MFADRSSYSFPRSPVETPEDSDPGPALKGLWDRNRDITDTGSHEAVLKGAWGAPEEEKILMFWKGNQGGLHRR